MAVESNIPPLSALLRTSEPKLSFFYVVTEDTFQTPFWKKNPRVPCVILYLLFLFSGNMEGMLVAR